MLKLKQYIELSGGCDQVCVQDTVGIYHITNNPTGWGAPNIDTTDPTTVEIRMQKYLGNDIFDEEYSIDASATLPNTADTVFCFTSAEIKNSAGNGYGDKFADGVYKVRYCVGVVAPLEYVAEEYITAKCEASCCLAKAITKLGSGDCDDGFQKKYEHLKLQMDLLNSSIKCGNVQAIYDYLDYIAKLCAICGCVCK